MKTQKKRNPDHIIRGKGNRIENLEWVEVCALCGSPDRDKECDHLRECYKLAQDKLDNSQYHPRLFYEEMNTLQRGSNPICSNRRKCRERQNKK